MGRQDTPADADRRIGQDPTLSKLAVSLSRVVCHLITSSFTTFCSLVVAVFPPAWVSPAIATTVKLIRHAVVACIAYFVAVALVSVSCAGLGCRWPTRLSPFSYYYYKDRKNNQRALSLIQPQPPYTI